MTELDIYQKQAVYSEHPNTVVTACPGAGKTTVICERVKRTLDIRGIVYSKSDIVLITYTNAAANEFRERLPGMAVECLAFCGTIHGFAKWFLDHYCLDPDGKQSSLSVMDEAETLEQLQRIADSMRLKITKTDLKSIARSTAEPTVGVTTDPKELLYRAHLKEQWNTSRFSFAGLLYIAKRELKRLGGRKFDLIVDEYQDASASTHELLEELPTMSRFYVGDANQSVFGFIGGSPTRLMELAARANEDRTWLHITLQNTYRCAHEIADAANKIVDRLPSRTVMASRQTEPGQVDLNEYNTSIEEQMAVAKAVMEVIHVEDEVNCAVLCRTNAQCEDMRAMLRNLGVLVKERVRGEQLPGLRQALVILDYLAKPGSEHAIEAVNRLIMPPSMFAELKQKALRECRQMSAPVMRPMNQKYGEIGLIAAHIFNDELRIPEETLAAIDQAEHSLPQGATAGDLAMLLRSPDFETEAPESAEHGVEVTTVHGAKGLEWDAVWIVGANECYWKGSADEERRLFYVALTRARVYASVSWACMCARSVKGRVLDPVASEPVPAVRELLELLERRERSLPRTRLHRMPPELQTGAMNEIESRTDLDDQRSDLEDDRV